MALVPRNVVFAAMLASVVGQSTLIKRQSCDGEQRTAVARLATHLAELTRDVQAIQEQLSDTQALVQSMHTLCDVQGILHTVDADQYMFVNESITWYKARERCHQCGFGLAQITSEQESDDVSQWLGTLGSVAPWIDGADERHEGCWLLTYPSITPITYSRWHKGEPNNVASNEHCLSLFDNGTFWNDAVCTSPRPYVCKRLLTAPPLVARHLPTIEEVWAAECL